VAALGRKLRMIGTAGSRYWRRRVMNPISVGA
jgi:hypothetical protein